MNRWILLLAATATLLVECRAASQLLNGIRVIVDDAVITQKDLMQFIGSSLDVLQRTYAGQPALLNQKMQEMEQEGLEQLVERKLILREYKTLNYNLPESLFEDNIRKRVKERFGDRLNASRSLQAEGITYETYRQRLKEDIIISLMRVKNLAQDIIVSPYKIEKYYAEHRNDFKMQDQVRLRTIMVTQAAGAPPGTAKKLAEELLAKLDEGAPFAELASVYSEGSQRVQGGDWGWVERSVLRKELADVAFSVKPGARTGVVEIGDACYILLVEDAKANHTKTLPEVREEIEKSLLTHERARLNKQWIDRLKAKSFVRYF